MIKNYLKIAMRNLMRYKLNAFVNILGLGTGMALFLLMILFTKKELSTDTFHENVDRIYRVEAVDFSSSVAAKVGDIISESFPEIEKFARMVYNNDIAVAYQPEGTDDIRRFMFNGVCIVDTSFFDMFSFGNPNPEIKEMLAEPFTLAITKSTAKKIFGDVNPIGKSIQVYVEETYFKIVDVIDDAPENSSLNFSAFMSMETFKVIRGENVLEDVNNWFYSTYFLMNKSVDIPAFDTKMNKMFGEYIIERFQITDPNYEPMRLRIRSLETLYFDKDYYTAEYHKHGNRQMVNIILIIAFFTLTIAVVNFVNLSTSQALIRAKEVGIRKVSGAQKRHLLGQLLGESIILSIISLNIAILIIEAFKPLFAGLIEMNLKIGYVDNPFIILMLLLGAIVIGLLAGIYPAIYLTSFKPVAVLKGNALSGGIKTKSRFNIKTKGLQRKILIVFQFTISIVLVIGTLMVREQMQFVKKQDLGFDKEHIIYFNLDQSMMGNIDAFRNELNALPEVKKVSFSNFQPDRMGGNSFIRTINEQQVHCGYIMCDPDFIELMGIEVLKGRNFSYDNPSDKDMTIILNEKAVEAYHLEDPFEHSVGLFGDGQIGQVVGVVKDFNFKSLHNEIDPLIIVYMPSFMNTGMVKVSGNDVEETLKQMQGIWSDFTSLSPFIYSFLDEGMDSLYKTDQRFGRIFMNFSIMAIIIASMGLFALIAFITIQKTKEIGIRKVLGANVSNVVLLFSNELIKLITVSLVIATPIAYYLIDLWLQNFAYHTKIKIWTFIVSGMLALLIALLTSAWHTVKASRANPAESLRYE